MLIAEMEKRTEISSLLFWSSSTENRGASCFVFFSIMSTQLWMKSNDLFSFLVRYHHIPSILDYFQCPSRIEGTLKYSALSLDLFVVRYRRIPSIVSENFLTLFRSGNIGVSPCFQCVCSIKSDGPMVMCLV
jgi:hypothetical protein